MSVTRPTDSFHSPDFMVVNHGLHSQQSHRQTVRRVTTDYTDHTDLLQRRNIAVIRAHLCHWWLPSVQSRNGRPTALDELTATP